MRAIIVAAGMGRRLAPYTNDRPKCLVEIGGRSILEHQLAAYRTAGIDEFSIVRGHMGDRIRIAGCRYFDNPDYRTNNILASLFCAEEAMEGGFLFSYCDIVFRASAVARLLESAADYGLIVDRRWAETYEGRTDHPAAEAELARVADGRVLAVGKRQVAPARAHGEFIGLARFSARAAEEMRREYHRLLDELGPERPFGNASRFGSAFLTDLLNHLIARGEIMASVDIDGGWREIDTVQDLARAREILKG